MVLGEVERGSACAQFVDRRYCKVPTGDLDGGHGLISFFSHSNYLFFSILHYGLEIIPWIVQEMDWLGWDIGR